MTSEDESATGVGAGGSAVQPDGIGRGAAGSGADGPSAGGSGDGAGGVSDGAGGPGAGGSEGVGEVAPGTAANSSARIPAGMDVACHLNVLLADPASDLMPSALATLAEAGYRRIVLPPVDPATFDAAGLRRVCEARGITAIPIAGQTPDADVSSPDPEIRRAGAEELRRMLDVTVALGGDQLNGVPYGVFARPDAAPDAEAFARAAAEVGEFAELAHERGVTVTFEVLNRYETAMVNTAEQAMAFAEASGSEHLGIHLDTFHMAVEEQDLSAAIRTALPRLAYLELGQSGRGSLRHGSVDVPGVVRQALADGYTGRWGIEAFSDTVLPPPAQQALAVWRDTYRDGIDIALDAVRLIRRGWSG